ncbi:MAG: IclR family transcriptional regulator [Asticcacaulis sp.]
MKDRPESIKSEDSKPQDSKTLAGTQTLVRGLDVISAVSDGHVTVQAISESLNLTRSTAHRLASTLVDQRFLNFTPRVGYSLGPKLLELGHQASRQMSLTRTAHDYLVNLAHATSDTVHLGIRDGDHALYLDKVPGGRRVEISSRVGDRHPLRSTGLGKALLLDESPSEWAAVYDAESVSHPGYMVGRADWLGRMDTYAAGGYSFDLEENEDRIRCVAAPVRDMGNRIIGALSLSSAAQYMDDDRMQALIPEVIATARAISSEFGWTEKWLED